MAKSIDLVTLRLFVAVCEENNIARAADREAIAASAVSRRIAAIEEQIGASLLVRGRRGIKPSAAGETLLRHAREVLGVMDRLDAELSDYASGVHGHVRVVATPAVLAEDIAEDIRCFLEKCPRIRVSTDERVSSEVLRTVRQGAADIGVLWDASDLTDLYVQPYRHDRLSMVVPAGHPLAARDDVRFEEIIEQVTVGAGPGGMMDILLRREAAKLSRPLVHRVQVSGIDVALRFVAAGMGPAILPREAALRHAEVYAIASVPLTDEWAYRQFVVITRNEHSTSAAARLLIEHLRDRAAANRG